MCNLTKIILGIVLLIVPAELLANDWFDIKTSKDTIEMRIGDTSSFIINFIRNDSTFEASLFLEAGYDSYMFLADDGTWKPCLNPNAGGGISQWLLSPPVIEIPTNVINKPYNSQTYKVNTNNADSGFFRVYFTIKNGNKSSKDSIYIRVKPIQNWYLIQLIPNGSWKPLYPSCLTVTQDNSIHNFYEPSHEKIIGTGSQQRRLIYTGVDEMTSPLYLMTFAFNKKNEMWIDKGNGLSKIDRNYTTLYDNTNSPYQGMSSDSHRYIIFAEGSNSTEYVATDIGFYSVQNGVVTDILNEHHELFHGLNISSLYSNPTTNDIYVSTRNYYKKERAGIYRFNGIIWDSIVISIDGIPLDSIYGFYELKQDKANNLWAIVQYQHASTGYAKKLVMYNGTEWILFPALDSIPVSDPKLKYEAAMLKFEFDMHGSIWLITGWKQLVQFDGVSVKKIYNSDNSPLKLQTILPFFIIDSSNTFYFASDAKGGKYLQLFNPDGIPALLMASPLSVINKSNSSDYECNISPNPATTSLTVSGLNGVTSLRVVNSLGIEILRQKVESYQSEINVSNLPSGVYYVQLNSTKSMTSKMITVYH